MKNLKYLFLLLPVDALAHPGHDGLAAASGLVQGLLSIVVVVSALLVMRKYRQRKTSEGND